MPRAQEPKVRYLVASAARDRLDVVNVQAEYLLASFSVGSHECASIAVAREHGVARAHRDRGTISRLMSARRCLLTPLVSFCRRIPANEILDQRDKHGFEGEPGKPVGQERGRDPVFRHE